VKIGDEGNLRAKPRAKVRFGENAKTSTRDACAPQFEKWNVVIEVKSSAQKRDAIQN